MSAVSSDKAPSKVDQALALLEKRYQETGQVPTYRTIARLVRVHWTTLAKDPRFVAAHRLRMGDANPRGRRLPERLDGAFADSPGILHRLAAEICQCDPKTLLAWHKNGCPYFKGQRKLRAKRVAIPSSGPKVWVFHEGQIREIAARRQEALDAWDRGIIEDQGRRWLTDPKADEEYRLTGKMLDSLRRVPRQFLDGRTLRAKPFPFPLPNSGCGKRWINLEDDLKRIAVIRDAGGPTRPPDLRGRIVVDAKGTWLPTWIARERFGFDNDTLAYWATAGCPYLEGRKLTPRRDRTGKYGRGKRARWLYLEADLELIKSRRKAKWPTGEAIVKTDARGTWIDARAAEDRHDEVNRPTLFHWGERCPYLNGKVIRTRVFWQKWTAKRKRRRVLYHEGDLKQALASRDEASVAETPQPLPAAATDSTPPAAIAGNQGAALASPETAAQAADTNPPPAAGESGRPAPDPPAPLIGEEARKATAPGPRVVLSGLDKPVWDKRPGELRFRGQLARKIDRIRGRNIALIVASFDELGWPRSIPDPLTGKKGIDHYQRLVAAVKSLNQGLVGLRFHTEHGKELAWTADAVTGGTT